MAAPAAEPAAADVPAVKAEEPVVAAPAVAEPVVAESSTTAAPAAVTAETEATKT